MGILQKYGLDDSINELVTEDDIALEISELLADIEHIEKKHSTVLVGERSHLNDPYVDCKGMTRGQCAHFFSVWRNGILSRYMKR